jgi:uncharacterized protein (DUF305 family)
VVLIGALVVAALVIAGAIGGLLGNHGSASIGASSADAGFARDMSAHHDQAVQMAGYTRDHTTDQSIKLLAYDIETAQYVELGQMQGWLDSWGLSRSSIMIRHHQGGLPMAQFAAAHAGQSYIRDLARKMVQSQSNEIITMEQLLRQLGGSPLPAPD